MARKKKTEAGAPADAKNEPFVRPEPDFSKDKNAQARARIADKRKPAEKDSPPAETPKVIANDDDMPKPAEVDNPEKLADGGEVEPKMADGGIVAEAEKELEAVSGGEAPGETENEPPAEAANEEANPEAESAEAPAEQAAEAPAPEAPGPGEYQAPEGESHDELIDKYHEALAFGDNAQAKELYKQLQAHRFAENAHRSKSEAFAEKSAQDFLNATQAIIAKHPELGEDGLEADKVLAVSDVYRNNGMSAVEAIQKAVADLFPESAAPETTMPMGEPPAPEAPVEEPAPAEEPPMAKEEPVAEPMIPDMTARTEAKKNIPSMPVASAKNEPAPEPEAPSRSSAIKAMKEKRGQV